MARRPTLDDVFRIDRYMDLVDEDEPQDCPVCGDPFEVDEFAVSVPFPEAGPRAILVEHFHCAVRNREITLTGTVAGYAEDGVSVVG